MPIAGTSEFLLLASLLFAVFKGPKLNAQLRTVYLIAIVSTFVAATMGVFRYLELADTIAWHSAFSFASKHLGMALFISIALLTITTTKQEKKPIYILLSIGLVSVVVNLITSFEMLSDAIIALLLAYGIYLKRKYPSIAIQLSVATVIILSTLAWGAIVHNPDIRLGIFHLCLSLFIFLFIQGISQSNLRENANQTVTP